MLRVIHQSRDTQFESAQALWLTREELERATGWRWKPEGLCRDETCLPIRRDSQWVHGDRLDVAGFWRSLDWPIASDRSQTTWVLGEGAAAALRSLDAPDFELPDLDGRTHRLSDFRGRRVFLVTWASWCGCRNDFPLWKALNEAAKDFTVLAIALDHPEAAKPWIEAARPNFPCLVDPDHRTAQLYNLVNVPQAVWIDETGRIVRPPESAGMTDAFREMDRTTLSLPPSAVEERQRAKTAYFAAARDWALRGAESPYVLDATTLGERLQLPSAEVEAAHAHFRLGQVLLREGHADEASHAFAEAIRLHPSSWAMWRQVAAKDARGLAISPEFWARVDALGNDRYYAPVRL